MAIFRLFVYGTLLIAPMVVLFAPIEASPLGGIALALFVLDVPVALFLVHADVLMFFDRASGLR